MGLLRNPNFSIIIFSIELWQKKIVKIKSEGYFFLKKKGVPIENRKFSKNFEKIFFFY